MGLFGCLPRNSSYLSHSQTLTQVMSKFMLNPTNFCPTVANKTDYCWEQWLYETGKGATSYDTVVSPSRRNFSSLNVRATECCPTDWLHYLLYSCCVAFSFWVQQIHTGLHLSGNIMKTHRNQFWATDLLKTHECSNPHLGMLPKNLWIWLWGCSWLFSPIENLNDCISLSTHKHWWWNANGIWWLRKETHWNLLTELAFL